jgi:hypothetical protein
MNLGDVMDQVGDRANTITGLRVFKHPPPKVSPPAAWVAYPEGYVYDATYGRGMDRITNLGVVVVVGKVSDRSARDRISAYADGSGARSIKAVLEAGTYTAFDTIRVVDASFDVLTVAGDDYLAALFTLDIAGQGSA